MEKINYIFLEDSEETLTTDIVDSLNSERKDFEIKIKKPSSFGSELKQLLELNYDGLLMDLRLDEFSEAEYRAFTLAQEIRTRTSESDSNWNDVPIALCSSKLKLTKSYLPNIAGQDLFDKKYEKTEEIIDDPKRVVLELFSLAKGYRLIKKTIGENQKFKIKKLFFLSEDELELIDERLINFKISKNQILPTHEYARFILRELLEKPNALLDKEMILARLGIAMNSKDIDKLFERTLDKYKYKGPFNEAWERWWWPLINNWWLDTFKKSSSLVGLEASERVENLNKQLKLNLKAASSIEKGYSKKFWTICQFYREPLSMFDGFLLDQSYEPFPWQESRYISAKGALDPKSQAKGFFVHQVDKERFDRLKKASK